MERRSCEFTYVALYSEDLYQHPTVSDTASVIQGLFTCTES